MYDPGKKSVTVLHSFSTHQLTAAARVPVLVCRCVVEKFSRYLARDWPAKSLSEVTVRCKNVISVEKLVTFCCDPVTGKLNECLCGHESADTLEL